MRASTRIGATTAIMAVVAALVGSSWSRDAQQTTSPAGEGRSDVVIVGSESPRSMLLNTAPSYERAGVLRPRAPFTIASMVIDSGRYTLGYSFDARHTGVGAVPSTLRCALVELPGGGLIRPQEALTISAADGEESLSFRLTDVNLPATTVAVQCAPSRAGLVRSRFSDVALFALRLD